MKHVILALPLALLAACGGISYAMTEYSGVEVIPFTDAQGTRRIFDRPDATKLMITPSLARTSVSGATFGTVGGVHEGPVPYRTAADAWLAPRNCKTGTAKLVLDWQYEFTYTCGG